MSYHRKARSRYARRRSPPVAMGDLASAIANIGGAIGTVTDLATDPYLPETVCRIGQVSSIHKGQKPGACVTTHPNLPGGVGLRKMIVPLRAYAYAEAHPWTYAVAALGIIGLPFLLGYRMGQGRKG